MQIKLKILLIFILSTTSNLFSLQQVKPIKGLSDACYEIISLMSQSLDSEDYIEAYNFGYYAINTECKPISLNDYELIIKIGMIVEDLEIKIEDNNLTIEQTNLITKI